MIASSLGISVRTVEFHLKNIYAKFRVSSRVELILKLGNTTGGLKVQKLGESTVANTAKFSENRDGTRLRSGWAAFLQKGISISEKEPDMKGILLKYLLVGMVTAILIGLLWVLVLENTIGLAIEDFTLFTVPFFIILAMVGVMIGTIGERRHRTLPRTLFSIVLGTGLSPFVVIPIMRFIVIPLGELAGVFNTFAIPDKIESDIAMGIMITLWLVASITLGVILLTPPIKLSSSGNRGSLEGGA